MKLHNGKLPKSVAGSWSWGSHIPEHVWAKCRELLPKHKTENCPFVSEGDKLFRLIQSGKIEKGMPEYEAFEHIVWESMFNYLNEVSPKGYYFGSHIGDGSDFGFWEVNDLY